MSIISTVPKGAAVEGINPNLLRNWYFVGGGSQQGGGQFPINQRGDTYYGIGQQYTIDGWLETYGSGGVDVNLYQNGIGLAPHVSSNHGYLCCLLEIPVIEALIGKKVTGTMLLADGSLFTGTITLASESLQEIVSDNYDNKVLRLSIDSQTSQHRFAIERYGSEIIIAAVKFELGSQQTLAHMENGVWVLNEVPNYHEELTKCQTSTADPSDIYANKVLSTNIPNKNLVENGYFQYAVNQRGATTVNALSTYFIDRWKSWNSGNGSASISSSGFSITGNTSYFLIAQRVATGLRDKLFGKTITLSVITQADGLLQTTVVVPSSIPSSNFNALINTTNGVAQFVIYTDGSCYFAIRAAQGHTEVFKALKCELGTEQTLAHLEGSTWVLNEIPDYEYELYRCITSTADSSDTYANKSLATEQQIAYVETGTTASRAYAIGEHFCWNGLLYRAKTAISSGDSFIVGTNCVQVTVANGLVSPRTITVGTNANGRLSTQINVANGIVLGAVGNGYFCSVYVNNNIQGIEVRDLSGSLVTSTTVTLTLVVLYI